MRAVSRSIGSLRNSPAARSSRASGKLVMGLSCSGAAAGRHVELCHRSRPGGTPALPRRCGSVSFPDITTARAETVMPLDNGCCDTGPADRGSHTVCVVATAGFLEFSKSRGNDLSTPVPDYGFPGVKPGDRWCLCAPRWQEAFDAGLAPRVVLRATHEGALAYCSLADLKRYAVDLS